MGRLRRNDKKNIGLYVLILCNLFMMPFFHSKAMTKEEGIKHAFVQSEAALIEVNMNAHVKFTGKKIEKKDIVALCQRIVKTLDLAEQKIHYTADGAREEAWTEGSGDKEYVVRSVIHRSEAEGDEAINLIVEIVLKDEQMDIEEAASKLTNVLDAYGKIHLTSCVIGSYQGQLPQANQKEMIQTIFSELKAKEVEGIYEKDIVSVVGYTNEINDWIHYSRKKANLHIAMRYNAYEDKTMIWIGTPLITMAY